MPPLSKKLIKACRKNDKLAQSKLHELCFGFLMPVAMRYASCEDDARMYLNLAFYKILKNLGKLKDTNAFEAWARQILIRSILDELKKDRRYLSYVVAGEESHCPELSDDCLVEENIDAEDIYVAIRSLPPVTGSVFNLHAIDGYKHREIADMLGIETGTVKWHYAEARKRLKEMLSYYQPVRKDELIPPRNEL